MRGIAFVSVALCLPLAVQAQDVDLEEMELVVRAA